MDISLRLSQDHNERSQRLTYTDLLHRGSVETSVNTEAGWCPRSVHGDRVGLEADHIVETRCFIL